MEVIRSRLPNPEIIAPAVSSYNNAAIHTAPGGLDVIDTTTLTNAKRIALGGMIHNPFVTPDGKYVIAASDDAKTMTATVIDHKTEEPVRSIQFDGRPSPLAFSTNPDSSTKWFEVQSAK
jgi:DNA-binding beta-propeller fold protein YncE